MNQNDERSWSREFEHVETVARCTEARKAATRASRLHRNSREHKTKSSKENKND